MLDKYVVPTVRPPLKHLALWLHRRTISADQVTVFGFVIGLFCVLLLAFNQVELALLMLLLNRLADGVDGELARLNGASDAGGFLDITLDFIFYALFPLGFAFANPDSNALAAAALIASFMGTGASFLAFSSLAQKQSLQHPFFAYKSLFYLNGLAEGTETVLFFIVMCLLPQYFSELAWLFATICCVTAINRVVAGYQTLKQVERGEDDA